jgi:hypothetical protein
MLGVNETTLREIATFLRAALGIVDCVIFGRGINGTLSCSFNIRFSKTE